MQGIKHRVVGSLAAVGLAVAGLNVGATAAQAAVAKPAWKIQVIVYKNTDFSYVDSGGSHRFVGSMVPADVALATSDATKFVRNDIPALSSGNQHPTISIKLVDAPLTKLDPDGPGFTPSPYITTSDLDPTADSHIILWQSAGWDFVKASNANIAHSGGLTWYQGTASTFSSIPFFMLQPTDRNVFKHEWGHAILFFYQASGASPLPAIDNHQPQSSVNCHTGSGYVLVDDSDTSPVPNSIFNDSSGFTHDYYSGISATSSQPRRCLGITPAAWTTGGPVVKPSK
jgi:hypothetical protein